MLLFWWKSGVSSWNPFQITIFRRFQEQLPPRAAAAGADPGVAARGVGGKAVLLPDAAGGLGAGAGGWDDGMMGSGWEFDGGTIHWYVSQYILWQYDL